MGWGKIWQASRRQTVDIRELRLRWSVRLAPCVGERLQRAGCLTQTPLIIENYNTIVDHSNFKSL